MRVVGLDPAFANFGMVAGSLLCLKQGEWKAGIGHMALLQTQKLSGGKSSMRVSTDTLRRAQELHRGLHDFLDLHQPELVFVEVPSGAQSASAAQALGVAIGVLGSIRVPTIEVTPLEVKRLFSTRKESIPKTRIMAWAYEQWPSAPWVTHGGKRTLANEHLADACATIVAGTRTDTFNQLLAMRGTNEIPMPRDHRSTSGRQPIDGLQVGAVPVAERANTVARRKVLEDLG